jgi:hypothetical protein
MRSTVAPMRMMWNSVSLAFCGAARRDKTQHSDLGQPTGSNPSEPEAMQGDLKAHQHLANASVNCHI